MVWQNQKIFFQNFLFNSISFRMKRKFTFSVLFITIVRGIWLPKVVLTIENKMPSLIFEHKTRGFQGTNHLNINISVHSNDAKSITNKPENIITDDTNFGAKELIKNVMANLFDSKSVLSDVSIEKLDGIEGQKGNIVNIKTVLPHSDSQETIDTTAKDRKLIDIYVLFCIFFFFSILYLEERVSDEENKNNDMNLLSQQNISEKVPINFLVKLVNIFSHNSLKDKGSEKKIIESFEEMQKSPVQVVMMPEVKKPDVFQHVVIYHPSEKSLQTHVSSTHIPTNTVQNDLLSNDNNYRNSHVITQESDSIANSDRRQERSKYFVTTPYPKKPWKRQRYKKKNSQYSDSKYSDHSLSENDEETTSALSFGPSVPSQFVPFDS
jgi:hypothetical protein